MPSPLYPSYPLRSGNVRYKFFTIYLRSISDFFTTENRKSLHTFPECNGYDGYNGNSTCSSAVLSNLIFPKAALIYCKFCLRCLRHLCSISDFFTTENRKSLHTFPECNGYNGNSTCSSAVLSNLIFLKAALIHCKFCPSPLCFRFLYCGKMKEIAHTFS